ncbi:hypothetical protein COW46_05200 [Candidatus Gracilibacteria bacterium CG17_big_fil_post_rev_8_21_14_2_50_48_13]|nr:MAG: hypothetical protein COW46_05200 [Candidatus Gracilibacteria bacterium CG17_big_fil_post_rev_8_21_14_2_50_48_13]
MQTNSSNQTAEHIDQQLNSLLAPLEKQLAELFFTKAPRLPKEITELLVTLAPIFSLVGLFLWAIAILAMAGVSLLALPLWAFAAPAATNAFFYMLLSIVGWLLLLASIPGLFSRSKTGWNFAFYGSLWQGVINLVTFNLLGLIVGLAVSLYFLFQMRPWYGAKLPGAGQTSAK